MCADGRNKWESLKVQSYDDHIHNILSIAKAYIESFQLKIMPCKYSVFPSFPPQKDSLQNALNTKEAQMLDFNLISTFLISLSGTVADELPVKCLESQRPLLW